MLGILKLTDIGPKKFKSYQKNITLSVSIKNTITQINETELTNSSSFHTNEITDSEDATNNLEAKTQEFYQPTLIYPEPKFYTIKELDHPPKMMGEIDSRPAELAQYHEGGEIKIQIWIDEDGNVMKSEIVESNLSKAFNDNTLASFNKAKFSPGIKDGIPVRSVAKIVVQYSVIN